MSVKKFKPTTPGLRWRVGNSFSELSGSKPERSLLLAKKRSGGRNSQGRLTVRYIGGGHKRHYRIIDFKRDKVDIPAVVASIEYDPNRSAFISLLNYVDGEKRYILAPKGIKVGDKVVSGESVAPELGNALPLSKIPLGTFLHNIEMHPGAGGVLARSAGSSAQLNAKEDKYAVLKMPSGETRRILITCTATVGVVSNADHSLEQLGKAGNSRHRGWRPRVRGVAMNPVDHPMGGGEGRASGGHPRTRKGLKAKGLKTRRKKASDALILQRSKKS